jgi:hypothetical protein
MNASQRNDISPDGFLAKAGRMIKLTATLSGGQEPLSCQCVIDKLNYREYSCYRLSTSAHSPDHLN